MQKLTALLSNSVSQLIDAERSAAGPALPLEGWIVNDLRSARDTALGSVSMP